MRLGILGVISLGLTVTGCSSTEMLAPCPPDAPDASADREDATTNRDGGDGDAIPPPPADAGADGQDGSPEMDGAPVRSWITETSGVSVSLEAVWGSGPHDIYAVGEYGTLLHSKGDGAWNLEAVATQAHLASVRGSGSGDVYVGAVGIGLADGGFIEGDLFHSMGTGQWLRADTTLFGPPMGGEAFGLWIRAVNDVWVTGVSYTHGSVWHYATLDGGNLGWSEQTLEPGGGGMWGSGDDDLYIASNQMFHSRDGNVWSAEATADAVYNVWGSGKGDVYAVSDGYKIFHSTGDGQWTAQHVPQSGGDRYWACMDVWGTGPSDIYAVGGGDFATNGAILHTDGSGAWTLVRDDLTPLYAIWGFANGEMVAVGSHGTILHYK